MINTAQHIPTPPPSIYANNKQIEDIPLPISYEQYKKSDTYLKLHKQNEVKDETHELSWPQYYFVTSKARFPAMIAGYGAGKTEAGVVRALKMKFQYPEQNVGYYLPTYDLVKQIVFPRIKELLTQYGYAYFLNETDKVLTIYGMKGVIIFRTMDKPENIIGYEHAHSIIDEIDVLPAHKAVNIWRKVVARNRQKTKDGEKNTIGVVTTPEGFKFVYEFWKKTPRKGSQIIKASTRSNAKNLPEDYIDNLKDNYPDQQLQAYLEGEFVNMTTGSVYPDFDRVKNAVPLGIGIKPNETLHIGIDFNVGTMAAVVHILRDGEALAIDEFIGYLDTPALIKAIKERYQSKGHRIMAYPDATGKSRKSINASQSDIALLRQAGFVVLAKTVNPFVKDRINAFNKMIHKDEKRRYKVNIDNCPHLVEALEKQAYTEKGEPDKTSGFDHIIDAAGYFVAYRYPIVHGKAIQTNLKGT